jgi:hypothetical protein
MLRGITGRIVVLAQSFGAVICPGAFAGRLAQRDSRSALLANHSLATATDDRKQQRLTEIEASIQERARLVRRSLAISFTILVIAAIAGLFVRQAHPETRSHRPFDDGCQRQDWE